MEVDDVSRKIIPADIRNRSAYEPTLRAEAVLNTCRQGVYGQSHRKVKGLKFDVARQRSEAGNETLNCYLIRVLKTK